MPFLPHTDADRKEMLQAIGLTSLDDLFESIPAELRLEKPLDLPSGMSEAEVRRDLAELASWNSTAERGSFLGAGMYRHHIPAVVDALASRQEFVTAYTPYQPEASQGTLTAFFEFQTMVADLFGMEVANASMYEGASAAAEAVHMAAGIRRGRTRVVVSAGVHAHARRTIEAYTDRTALEIVKAPLDDRGRTRLEGLLDERTCAVVVQQPNFLGVIEDLPAIAREAREAGAFSIASVYPIAMGVLASPGEAGIDVAVGDGQSLGVPLQMGGPSFGLFATRMEHVRRMPGRIVGETIDAQGRRGFTLTFQTREQHIRREKATSNICTNNALMALRGAIYLAAAGPAGLREVALHCLAKAQYAADRIAALPGFRLPFAESGTFNEFVVRCPVPAVELNRAIDHAGMIGGLVVQRLMPEADERDLLLAFTELTRREEVDLLVKTLETFASGASDSNATAGTDSAACQGRTS